MSRFARGLLGLSLVLSVALAGAPADVHKAVRQADDHVRAGRRTKALKVLDGIVAAHPRSLEAHVLYQDVKGKGPELAKVYRDRMRATPDDPVARYLYARLLKGRRAVGEARKLTRLAPEFAHGWVLYANTLRRTDRLAAARRAAERAVALDARLAVAHEALGRVREKAGDADKAEACYRRALKLDERNLKARYKLSHLLVRRGRGKEALETVRAARIHAPGDPLTRVHEGLVLSALGRRREAISAYREAVEAAPPDPLVLVLLGESYVELGEWRLADDAIDKALERDPKLAAAHAARGYAALRRKQLDVAMAAYKEAVRLAPKRASYAFYLGLLHARLGKHREAVLHYRRAAKASDNVQYRLALGGALEKVGRLREALTVYKEASRKAPEDPDPLIRQGHVASELRDYRRAARAFLAAHDLDPADKEVLLSLGITYEVGLRDRKRATHYYKKYLDAGGKDKRVQRWLDALKDEAK